ncbi:MAG TPA: protein kinase [Thermoanaerobaculia bacterium]|nr:protein kinase [Thermoanaerobaculia bacterium]
MTLTPGIRLGPYEILSPLGAGGMGEVWKARDTRLGRTVAIKVLPEHLVEDPDALARFEREARAVAALSHPNILALHDIGREGPVAYAVMELLEGETLRESLAGGALPFRRATDYAVQMALGLAAAHERGIVHRDLKPDNVFVTRDERVKILDFGLAKAGAAAAEAGRETQSPTVSGYTEPGKVMGTVGYMSPEQVRGLAVDHRSDIFSFGSVLFEMVTGRRPFARETAAETMTAILKDDPLEPIESGPGLPPPLAPVIRHCLEKKPERRFQSARDLAFALETAAAPSTAVPVLPARAPSRRAVRKGLGLLALAAGAAAAGYLAAPRRATGPVPDWKNATLARLTTDPGFEGEPTFSPDGQTIAYVADRVGNFEIYLQQISGGPAINLTQNSAADIQPAFSPDGREIAFVSDRSGGTEIFHAAPSMPHVGGDIWVMPALGGPARKIVDNGSFPCWTPDGSAILYVHGTYRNSRIAIVPSSGGVSRDLPIEEPRVVRYFCPRLSTNGQWLLFQNGFEIEVVSARGGKPKLLAQGEYPTWGAGSSSILFTYDQPGKSRTIWMAPFSLARGELSGPPQPLTFGRGADQGAAVSRDGSSIAFSSVDESLNLEEVPFDSDAGRVLGAERDLTAGNNRVGFFDSSPDGKSIVFDQDRGAGSHLWRVDPPSPPAELTRDPAYSERYPDWSPDGREVLFSRWASGEPEETSTLWIMNSDGTSPRSVTKSSRPASWMPDGKRILISQGDDVFQFDLASAKTIPVPGANGRTLVFCDPSGRWVVSQVAQGESLALSAVPVTGGTPRVVVAATYDAFHPFFSLSGHWLYFQRKHKNILRVPGPAQDWRPATPELVTNFSGGDLYIDQPTISRDGSRLLYTRGRRTGDIFILHPAMSADRK